MARRSGLPPVRGQQPRTPRSEREGGLDRIQAARNGVASRSLWLKRGSVLLVAGAVGFGVLQEWTVLRLAAIPLAGFLWWLDASLTHVDRRLELLYTRVFEGAQAPPLLGQELTLEMPEEAPDGAGSSDPLFSRARAMLSGPGAGLHWMMTGVAVIFNVLA